ncbi:MAG: hypothetical protein V1889_01975 [archaeon]
MAKERAEKNKFNDVSRYDLDTYAFGALAYQDPTLRDSALMEMHSRMKVLEHPVFAEHIGRVQVGRREEREYIKNQTEGKKTEFHYSHPDIQHAIQLQEVIGQTYDTKHANIYAGMTPEELKNITTNKEGKYMFNVPDETKRLLEKHNGKRISEIEDDEDRGKLQATAFAYRFQKVMGQTHSNIIRKITEGMLESSVNQKPE